MNTSFHRVTLEVASAPTVPDARVCSHLHFDSNQLYQVMAWKRVWVLVTAMRNCQVEC